MAGSERFKDANLLAFSHWGFELAVCRFVGYGCRHEARCFNGESSLCLSRFVSYPSDICWPKNVDLIVN